MRRFWFVSVFALFLPCLALSATPPRSRAQTKPGRPRGAAAGNTKAKGSAAAKPSPPRKRQGSSPKPLAHPKSAPPARLLPSTTIAPSPATDDPQASKVLSLQDALRSSLRIRPLASTRVGVEVMKVQEGQLLFAHNPDRMFDPASNEKILTTAAALARLGPEYRYRTVLFGPAPDEDGAISGDVYLRGSGDPSLATQDLVEIADQLVRKGVQRIVGGVVVDERSFERSSGAPVDTSDEQDELGYTAITLNRNTFAVRVRPSEHIGQPVEVMVDPPSEYLVVQNHATTSAGGRSRIRVEARGLRETMVVTVAGRTPAGHASMLFKRRPSHPALFAGSTLLQILRDLGIEVTGGAHAGRVPRGEAMLAVHESPPLSVIIRKSNKDSNNFVAERVFQTLGAELYGAPATAAKGQKAIREYLVQIGLRPNTFRADNGSGLAHTNRITPSALVTLLRKLYNDLAVAPDFLQSLAVGGVDGTIRRRFSGGGAVGLVRAKTGTLNGVSCLSGYVGDKDDVLAFSILVQGFRQRRLHEVRRAQVAMVNAMLRYVRGGSHPLQPDQPPPMDIESTEDTVDQPQDPEPTPLPPRDPIPNQY